MGIEFPQRFHLIRMNRSFPSCGWFLLESSLNVVEHTSVFCRSVINWLRPGMSFETVRQLLDPRSSSASLCGTPCTRKLTLKGFSCPTIDFSMPVCCCDSLYPLKENLITFGAYHFHNAVCWHWVAKDNGVRPGCQNVNHLSCALLKLMQEIASWDLFHLLLCIVPFVVWINLHTPRRVHCPWCPGLKRRQSAVLLWCPFHLRQALHARWSASSMNLRRGQGALTIQVAFQHCRAMRDQPKLLLNDLGWLGC